MDFSDYKVSVIIPTLNAEGYIVDLLQSLLTQSRKPEEIIVIDSKSDDNTVELCRGFTDVIYIEIPRKDFDHGKTRHDALQASNGDFVLFLTQDAFPVDSFYIENILKPFEDDSIAMVTGRQVAKQDALHMERLTREYNYPEQGFVRDKEDIPRLGIKTFFTSDCCSAYRRTAYNEVGGFAFPIPIGEDMIVAAKLLYADYKLAYCSNATVFHSHNYTLRQQYSRNFDIAANLEMNKDYFKGISVQSEGIRMALSVLKGLVMKGRLFQAIHYCIDCAARLLGYRHGVKYRDMGRSKILRKTANQNYWMAYDANH